MTATEGQDMIMAACSGQGEAPVAESSDSSCDELFIAKATGQWSRHHIVDRRGKARLRKVLDFILELSSKSATCNQHGPVLPGAQVNQRTGAETVRHGVGFVVRLVEWLDHGPNGGGSGAGDVPQPISLTKA